MASDPTYVDLSQYKTIADIEKAVERNLRSAHIAVGKAIAQNNAKRKELEDRRRSGEIII